MIVMIVDLIAMTVCLVLQVSLHSQVLQLIHRSFTLCGLTCMVIPITEAQCLAD